MKMLKSPFQGKLMKPCYWPLCFLCPEWLRCPLGYMFITSKGMERDSIPDGNNEPGNHGLIIEKGGANGIRKNDN